MYKGSFVAIVTPFHDDLSIHHERFASLLEWHIEQGTDGIVVLGTTGEAPTISTDEKLRLFQQAVSVVNGRVPVIAGTGSNDTMQTLALSRKAAALGVDGLLLVSPYYNRSNDAGLIQHFTTIADHVDVPIILYNVPSRTGQNLPVDVVETLSRHERIIGIKEASGNLSYTARVAAATPGDFLLFSGNDDVVLPVLSLGGSGVISVAANVIPGVMSKMVHSYLDGDTKTATHLQLEYLDLIDSLFIENNPIPVKELMNVMGLDVGGYRLPLYEMADKNKAFMKDIHRRYFS